MFEHVGLYIYICIYKYVYKYTNICTYTYVHVCIHRDTYICILYSVPPIKFKLVCLKILLPSVKKKCSNQFLCSLEAGRVS